MLSTSTLDTYSISRRYLSPEPTTYYSCRTRLRTALDGSASTYFLRTFSIPNSDDSGPRRATLGLPCYPSPLRLCLRLFPWFRLLHGASRPSSSALLHLYYLFCLQSFVYEVHVRNDQWQQIAVYAFCHLGLYCGVLFGMGVHGTSNPSQSARFDCNSFGFGFHLSTHETPEDSVISLPRTLETYEDSVVSVL